MIIGFFSYLYLGSVQSESAIGHMNCVIDALKKVQTVNIEGVIEKMSFLERYLLDFALADYENKAKDIEKDGVVLLSGNEHCDNNELEAVTWRKIAEYAQTFFYWAVGLSACSLARRVMEYKEPEETQKK